MNIHAKVTAASIAGAVSVVLVFALGALGVTVPTEVAQAITVVLAFAAGYLKTA